jgi:hypothetical protein
MTKLGNPAAGVNAANQSLSDIPPTDCKELEKNNEKLRSDLSEDSSESVSKPFGSKGATTVAHGSLNGGIPIGTTSRLLPSRYDKRVVQGMWAEKDTSKRKQIRKTGKSNLCPEPAFHYKKAFRPHQSHCESKILETLFAPGKPKPTGTLLLNINWKNSSNPNSKLPCEACERVLCHAQKKCKLIIELCQEDPKDPPESMECPPSK